MPTTTDRKDLTKYRKGQLPVTDARNATEEAMDKDAEKAEFRVHVIRDKQVKETVYVVAPKDLERAEEIGIAARVKYDGPVDKCLVEFLSECAGGCGAQMASYDPRYSTGGPSVESVLNDPCWCVSCGAKKFIGGDDA